MKLSLLLATATMFFAAEAFGPSTIHTATRSLALNNLDSDAVHEALAASRTFGSGSKEARVAWDIVEEIRASDNNIAFKAGDNDALDDSSKNKVMYATFLELQKLGELQRDHIDSVKHITEQIRAVKIGGPKLGSADRLHNPILDHALTEAKAMTDKHGVLSPESKLAWEALEHIASDDLSEAMKGAIDANDECFVEMVEACEAIEELNRALFLNDKKEVGRYHG